MEGDGFAMCRATVENPAKHGISVLQVPQAQIVGHCQLCAFLQDPFLHLEAPRNATPFSFKLCDCDLVNFNSFLLLDSHQIPETARVLLDYLHKHHRFS